MKTSMDTKLSMLEIELAIIRHPDFDIRKNVVVSNVSFGLLDHEADMLVMTKSGYVTELEIKRSLADLKADFKKKHDHLCEIIRHLYYVVPESLKDVTVDLLRKHERQAGVLYYTEEGELSYHMTPFQVIPDAWPSYRKLFIEEQYQLARLGTMRVWNLKKKMAKAE